MKKNTLKNFCHMFTFIILTIVFLIIGGKILTPKWTDGYKQGQVYTLKGYYELEKNSLDVLFVGDSSILKGISPMKIYESTGIASYNYGISSARSYMFYYFSKELIKTQRPKVIIVDPGTFFYSTFEIETEQRKSFDYYPFGLNKISMIHDDIFDTSLFDKASYYFPILRYHERYSDISMKEIKKTFKKYPSYTYGYQITDKVKPNYKGSEYLKPTNQTCKMQDYTINYIEKLKDFLDQEGITLMVLNIPDFQAWNYCYTTELSKFLEERNIDFLDVLPDEFNFDWTTDSEDSGHHLNILGAEKISVYVGKYLQGKYNLPDHRHDSKYKKWSEDLEYYNKTTKQYTEKANKRVEQYRDKEKKTKTPKKDS